ncbi:hypothetical protein PV04_03898, partial [Phialophora macrospora]
MQIFRRDAERAPRVASLGERTPPLLRSLRVIFPTLTQHDLRAETSSLASWVRTLDFIRQRLPLATLDLTLCVQEAAADDGYYTSAEADEWDCYQRMVEPTAVLRGIQNLFILFPPPRDVSRAARNQVRERELQSRALGLVPRGFGGTLRT